jgi:hypothetical protein
MVLNYFKDEKQSEKESEKRGGYNLDVIVSYNIPSTDPKFAELAPGGESIDIVIEGGEKLVMAAVKNDPVSVRMVEVIQNRIGRSKKKAGELEKPDNDEKINEMYSEVLEALAIPEAKRMVMMDQHIELKWKLIQTHQSLLSEDDVSDASAWADLLKDYSKSYPSLVDSKQLKTVVQTSPKNWLISFMCDHGFRYMLTIIENLGLLTDISGYEAAVLTELLLCLKALMNNQLGLEGVLSIECSLDKIAACLQLGIEEINMQVLELLSVCCFFSTEGQAHTVNAMDSFRLRQREYARYTLIRFPTIHFNEKQVSLIIIIYPRTIIPGSLR